MNSFYGYKRATSAMLTALPSLLLGLFLSLPVMAQVSPGAVEPERPEAVLPAAGDQRDDLLNNESAPSQTGAAATTETRFPLSAVGLDYIPDPANLPAAVSAKLEAMTRDFVLDSAESVSLSELQQLALRLGNYLREQGYSLAQVYLPAQRVDEGALVLRVVPGLLAVATVSDSRLYETAQLESRFSDQLNQPVQQSQIEDRLLRIGDLPGIDVNGTFRAAEETGYTSLRLNVLDEDPLEFGARIDNHNVESTGDLRLVLDARLNNPLGLRDQFDAVFIQTFDRGELTNIGLRYELTSPDLIHRFRARYSESDYSTDSSSFDLDGETTLAELGWRAGWIRSARLNFATDAALAVKRAEQSSVGIVATDRLTVASLGLHVDGVARWTRALQGFSARYFRGLNNSLGSLDSAGRPGPTLSGLAALPGEFEKWQLSYQRLQSLSRNQSLYLRYAGQFSDDPLPGLEKMNLGGPYSVRSHEIGFYSGDRSQQVGLSWRVSGGLFSDAAVFGDVSWADFLQLEVFADYATGSNVGQNNSRVEIAGAGLQLEFDVEPVALQLIWATPFDDEESIAGVAVPVSDNRLWFSLSADF